MVICYVCLLFTVHKRHLHHGAFCVGKGVPNHRMRRNNPISPIIETLIPSSHAAVQEYHAQGGSLTLTSHFGIDPLCDDAILLEQRRKTMRANIPDYPTIFHELVNGNDVHFRNGLKLFIEMTERLSH